MVKLPTKEVYFYDKRLMSRYKRKGLIKDSDIQAKLQGLKDEEGHYDKIPIWEEGLTFPSTKLQYQKQSYEEQKSRGVSHLQAVPDAESEEEA